jgi:hypothetical protein
VGNAKVTEENGEQSSVTYVGSEVSTPPKFRVLVFQTIHRVVPQVITYVSTKLELYPEDRGNMILQNLGNHLWEQYDIQKIHRNVEF